MTYIASDLHGEYTAFRALLEKILFTDEDEMYICGDVIDKGRDSVRLLQLVMNTPNIHLILGNHEQEFLNYYHARLAASPTDFDAELEALRRCFPHDGYLLDWETVDFLEGCPTYIETDDFICVHAGTPLDDDGYVLPLDKATTNELIYNRDFPSPDLLPLGEKCIFFGHTPASYFSGEHAILTYLKKGRAGTHVRDYHKIHLDLCSWISGKVGCFCVENCRTYYATR